MRNTRAQAEAEAWIEIQRAMARVDSGVPNSIEKRTEPIEEPFESNARLDGVREIARIMDSLRYEEFMAMAREISAIKDKHSGSGMEGVLFQWAREKLNA